jgi:predicted metal-dependent hydrolase
MSMASSDFRGDGRDDSQAQFDFLEPAGEDSGHSIRVRQSRRARRLSVRVYPDARVEVVAPPRVRPAEVERFVASHRRWIDEKRAQALRNRPAPESFPPRSFELQLTRETFRLQIAGGSGHPRILERGGGAERVLQIRGAPDANLRPALRAWLMRAARERLESRVAALASAMNAAYSRVSIRRQRSRWGSCSARGTISLNCCLLFQRAEVVEYLIIHELSHLSHMNHSARFWRTVERHCADWRALDRELLQGWRHVPRWVFADR